MSDRDEVIMVARHGFRAGGSGDEGFRLGEDWAASELQSPLLRMEVRLILILDGLR